MIEPQDETQYLNHGSSKNHSLRGYCQPIRIYRIPYPEGKFLSNLGLKKHLTQDQNSPTFAKCNVTYVPILLGGLMNACNNTAPINIKSEYLFREVRHVYPSNAKHADLSPM